MKPVALQTRLSKAKITLVLEYPFVGTIALGMPFEFDERIPTAATNGKRVKFNPGFVNSLTDAELLFLVAHECFHPMLEHNFRRGNRVAHKWNRATDYVINQLLTNEGIGQMPGIGLLDAKIYAAGHGISEGIYNILSDDPEKSGYPLDDCEDGEGSLAEQQQQQAEWKVKIAQAAQAAKMVGKLSHNMQRFVDETLQAKVNWREVLYRFLVRCRKGKRSFARFNRRFLSQGLYLPSANDETMGELVFAIDCSGSIDQRTLDQFIAEVTRVREDLKPERLHVLYFDNKVTHVESYEQHDCLDIKLHGGGGTDYAPVFEKIIELEINPVAIVFLTDLQCSSFGVQPEAPVLWVSTGQGVVPFGEIVNERERDGY